MPDNIAALSEKEKQVLRLLTAGHDAKSVARHLGLSVHTINERLRDARRKLGSSSSRDAARQLLAAEGPAPQKFGPEYLGDAPGDGTRDRLQVADGGGIAARRARVWIGVSIMSVSLALAALAFSAQQSPPAAAPATATPTTAAAVESDAVRAARDWLALVDGGDWAASWRATNRSFQSLNTLERWSEVATAVQTPLGAPMGHELVNELFVPAPPMGYQLVQFRSHYANRPQLLVTLTLEQEDGRWKVAGITLDDS